MNFDYQKLTNRKLQTNYIARLYLKCGLDLAPTKNLKRLFLKHAKSVKGCQDYMKFMADNKIGKNNKVKIKNINRDGCHDRFCPNCQRAYSYKVGKMLKAILTYLLTLKTKSGKSYKYSLLFITPTIPNSKPTPTEVKNTQTMYKKYLRKFLNLPQLKGYGKTRHGRNCHGRILGSIVKFEQTVNHNYLSKWFKTINLHSHIIALVHNSYFHSRYYLSSKDWDSLWHKACGNNSYGINVEASYFKDKKGKKHINNPKALKHVISEITKYETKSQDFVSINRKYNPKQDKISDKTLYPFYALALGMKGQNHYLTRGILRSQIYQYRHGSNKFDKFSKDNDKSTVFKYKTFAKFNSLKKKYTYKYFKFSEYEIANYYCQGILIKGYQKLLKKARLFGTTLHAEVSKAKKHKRTNLAKGIARMSFRSDKDLIIFSYWKNYVIHKYFKFLYDMYYLGYSMSFVEATYHALKRLNIGINCQQNIKNWIYKPKPHSLRNFGKRLESKLNGIPHSFPDRSKFLDMLDNLKSGKSFINSDLVTKKKVADVSPFFTTYEIRYDYK